jgi:hypothetical protein
MQMMKAFICLIFVSLVESNSIIDSLRHHDHGPAADNIIRRSPLQGKTHYVVIWENIITRCIPNNPLLQVNCTTIDISKCQYTLFNFTISFTKAVPLENNTYYVDTCNVEHHNGELNFECRPVNSSTFIKVLIDNMIVSKKVVGDTEQVNEIHFSMIYESTASKTIKHFEKICSAGYTYISISISPGFIFTTLMCVIVLLLVVYLLLLYMLERYDSTDVLRNLPTI